MTSEATIATDLMAKHRAIWASGDYPAVAAEVIPSLGQVLVEACGVAEGDRVLDVGAGSGNAAIPAALAGADVVASDLTPELLREGERIAEGLGVSLEWTEANAEQLPFPNDAFDIVMSCVGVMFAPHHQDSADELIRVARPGGTIGMINWTPEGFIGQMFAILKPFAAAPPAGAQPPPLWGREEHVAELFAGRVTDVAARRQTLTVDRFENAEAFVEFFTATYGPTIAVFRNIADDTGRVQALNRELVELARRHDRGDGAMQWEYLLYTARKAV